MTRGEEVRIRDILVACQRTKAAERLLEEAETVSDTELADTALDAISYNLIIMGEAVKALPAELKQEMSEIPWSEIAGMRDVLAHQYFSVRASVVRDTLDAPMRDLVHVCQQYLLDTSGRWKPMVSTMCLSNRWTRASSTTEGLQEFAVGAFESGFLVEPGLSGRRHPPDAGGGVGLEQQVPVQGDGPGQFQRRGVEHKQIHTFGHQHVPGVRRGDGPVRRHVQVAAGTWLATRGPRAEHETEGGARSPQQSRGQRPCHLLVHVTSMTQSPAVARQNRVP